MKIDELAQEKNMKIDEIQYYAVLCLRLSHPALFGWLVRFVAGS